MMLLRVQLMPNEHDSMLVTKKCHLCCMRIFEKNRDQSGLISLRLDVKKRLMGSKMAQTGLRVSDWTVD